MDPFIYIATLELNPEKVVLTLLAGAMNPDRDRLQCKSLIIQFYDDVQKFVVWTKEHAFQIFVGSDLNYDKVLLDLFLTGALCTSAIHVSYYDLSKVIVDLMQKFTGLKNGDEYQIVEIIRSNLKDRGGVEAWKRNFAEFIAKEEQFEEDLDRISTRHVIGLINNAIQKKLALDIRNSSYGPFSIKITNL